MKLKQDKKKIKSEFLEFIKDKNILNSVYKKLCLKWNEWINENIYNKIMKKIKNVLCSG